MASEVRVNTITNRSGLSTVTFGAYGIEFVGITTVEQLNVSSAVTNINATGVSTFSGNIDLNADLDVDGHTELDGVNIAGVLTATSANFSGNVTVLGDLTYENVINVDAVGIATARSGLRVTGGGLDVTGVSTFTGDIISGSSGFFYDYSTGRLGVGIDPPGSARLHVKGHSSLNNSLLVDVNTGDSTLGFAENGTEKWRIENVTSADALRFYDVTNTAERLRITSSGNIGIGTDNPESFSSGAYNLVISSPSGSNSGITINSDPAGTDIGSIFFSHGTSANAQGRIRYDHSTDSMQFYTNGSTERLRITSDGDLLSHTGGSATYDDITGASNAGLVIGSNSYLSSGIVVRTSGLGTCRLYFADNSGNDAGRRVGSIEYSHDNDKLAFTAGGSNTMNMYAGNVRISGAGFQSGTSQSPLAVSSNLGTITAFFGAQTDVRGLTVSQYSSAIRFNGAEVAWGDIAYFPNGDSNEGSFRFGRHGSTISSTPTATIGVSGVYFPGTGISNANTLDDYEEGNVTITATPASGSMSVTAQHVRYTKIGRLVTVSGFFQTLASSASGDITFGGLPYATQNVTAGYAGGTIEIADYNGGNPTQILLCSVHVTQNSTNFRAMYRDGAGNREIIEAAEMDGSSNIGQAYSFNLMYHVA